MPTTYVPDAAPTWKPLLCVNPSGSNSRVSTLQPAPVADPSCSPVVTRGSGQQSTGTSGESLLMGQCVQFQGSLCVELQRGTGSARHRLPGRPARSEDVFQLAPLAFKTPPALTALWEMPLADKTNRGPPSGSLGPSQSAKT